jgi:hypothetical protein
VKVEELKELLDQYDDELEVRLAIQPHYPFECSISSVTSRSEALGQIGHEFVPIEQTDPPDENLDSEDPLCSVCGDTEFDDAHDDTEAECVFILEGEQERYASKRLWSGS